MQTIFKPDEMIPLIRSDEGQDFTVHAVRSRGHREAHHTLVGQCLVIEGFQTGGRGIGVSERLKVGNEFPGLVALLDGLLCPGDLLVNGDALVDEGPGAGAPGVAEEASLSGDGPVAVGTAEPGIQRYFLRFQFVLGKSEDVYLFPCSRVSTEYPFSARRRLATLPPNPDPITM